MVDIFPYVWYNTPMKQMSDLPQKNSLGYFEKDFFPNHYEDSKINQANITKGPKEIMNFFGDYEGLQKNQESFMI